jgi:hypothetical protein
MKRKILLSGLFCLLLSNLLQAQSVVVSGYYNQSDPRDEYVELLVISDDTDMRNWTIRDNNATQTSWQPEITFLNIAFWQHMRAGTIIMLRNRVISSGAVAHAEDTDPSDGYIELTLQNTSYFSGGTFGSNPSWAGNSMNFANDGDVIELRNSSATHIHALGHDASSGASWAGLPSPKLNHDANAAGGDAIFVCPGTSISEYGTTTPLDGTTWTTKNNTNLTYGLPNYCGGSSTANSDFWRSLREPVMTSQTVASSTAPTYPTAAATFTWNAATDPVPDDETVGYMIVFNTSATFGTPVDGTNYTVGAAIPGGGTVLAYVDNPNTATVSYTDYSANGTGTYCYRIYAYRYGQDNNNGNSYDVARGRAYNTTNFVSVNCQTNPLSIQLVDFTVENSNGQAFLEWKTNNESEAVSYRILHLEEDHSWTLVHERVADFSPSYQYTEEKFRSGWHYYRLQCITTTGEIIELGTRGLNFSTDLSAIRIFGNTLVIQLEPHTEGTYAIFSQTGQLQRSGDVVSGEWLVLDDFAAGIYFVRLDYQGKTEFQKLVIAH